MLKLFVFLDIIQERMSTELKLDKTGTLAVLVHNHLDDLRPTS